MHPGAQYCSFFTPNWSDVVVAIPVDLVVTIHEAEVVGILRLLGPLHNKPQHERFPMSVQSQAIHCVELLLRIHWGWE